MALIKRIFFFLAMNIAIIVVLNVVLNIIQAVTGINLTGGGRGIGGLFVYALIYGFVASFISLWLSRWMAKRSYGIILFDTNNLDHLSSKEKVVYDTVRDIANKNGISLPEIGVFTSPEANAFATGPTKNRSLVAVSSGLIEKMTSDEIEGVVAHEMAHILNGDMVTMTLLQGVLNAFIIFFAKIIANLFDQATDGKFGQLGYFAVDMLLQVVIGFGASIIAMWFSRHREFKADEGSARNVGKDKMIAALKRLQSLYEITSTDKEAGKLAAFQISIKTDSGFMQLFASHPPLTERIQSLENIRM